MKIVPEIFDEDDPGYFEELQKLVKPSLRKGIRILRQERVVHLPYYDSIAICPEGKVVVAEHDGYVSAYPQRLLDERFRLDEAPA